MHVIRKLEDPLELKVWLAVSHWYWKPNQGSLEEQVLLATASSLHLLLQIFLTEAIPNVFPLSGATVYISSCPRYSLLRLLPLDSCLPHSCLQLTWMFLLSWKVELNFSFQFL